MTTAIGVDKSFAQLDGPSLAAVAAALQLLPENASKLLRIQRLTALGCSLPRQPGSPRLAPSAVRAILKRSALTPASVLAQEDAQSEVFVQSLSFYGGSFLVSPGLGENSVAIAEDLLKAIFAAPDVPAEHKRRTMPFASSIMRLSNLVLARAGLRRGVPGDEETKGNAFVPAADRLCELVSAVILTEDDLTEYRLDAELLDILAQEPSQLAEPCADDWVDSGLILKPIMKVDHGYIVLQPVDLLTTLRHFLLSDAVEHGYLDALARAYRSVVRERSLQLLTALGAVYEGTSGTSDVLECHALSFDEGARVHLMIAADTLSDYDRHEPWGDWDTRRVLSEVEESIRIARSSTDTPRVLNLLVHATPGRSAFIGLGGTDERDATLAANWCDLQVIAHDSKDLIDLWYFAKALSRLRDEVRVFSFGLLDEYAIYRDANHSFYFGDGLPPTIINVSAGSGNDLRRTQHRDVDRHGVVLPESRAVVELVRRWPKSGAPIYVPEDYRRSFVLAELGDLQVFVHPPAMHGTAFARIALLLADSVAYWIWQINENFPGAPSRLAANHDSLVVQIQVDAEEPWYVASVPNEDKVGPALAQRMGSAMVVRFDHRFRSLLNVQNAAERLIVRSILEQIDGDLDEGAVEERLDAVAPLGRKTMFRATRVTDNPVLSGDGLRRVRHIHGQATAVVLDDLGEWIRATRPELGVGVVQGSDRRLLINQCVGHLFGDLRDRIRLYEGESLLRALVAHDEALLHEEAVARVRRPHYAACFGPEVLTVEKVDDEIRDSISAQIANRFLVELVAATAPTGDLSISSIDYDALLALSNEIVSKGLLSDAINYGLADPEVSMLESGRVGIEREDAYYETLTRYSRQRAAAIVNAATRPAADGGEPPLVASAPDSDLEDAALAEFGFTLGELSRSLGALAHYALEFEGGLALVDQAPLESRLASDAGLSPEKIQLILAALTLGPSRLFDNPGPTVYPWRFNRDVSFMRRPLIALDRGESRRYMFGARRVFMTLPFWHDSIVSSRYQLYATSASMKRYLGRARNRVTEEFNDAVAARLEKAGRVVRRRVTKFGRLRVERRPGEPLGDIDVLVLDTSRRLVVAIEAKDFEVARTPAELKNELEQTIVGEKSAVAHHLSRMSWISDNMGDVLLHFGIAPKDHGGWTLRGCIVISEPLLSPMLRESPLPFVTLDTVETEIFGAESRKTPIRSGRGRMRHGKSHGRKV